MRQKHHVQSEPDHVCLVQSVVLSRRRQSCYGSSLVTCHVASTFLHPFAPPALPGFVATMGALTPGWPVLRVLIRDNELRPVSTQVSLFMAFDLPTIPSSTTVLPSPHHGFRTLPQPDGPPRLSPGQTWTGRRECRHAVGGSPLASRLPDRLGRIRFVILRTGHSPPVASHPSSRRRSYFRLQVRNANLVGTRTPPIKRFQRRTGSVRRPATTVGWDKRMRSPTTHLSGYWRGLRLAVPPYSSAGLLQLRIAGHDAAVDRPGKPAGGPGQEPRRAGEPAFGPAAPDGQCDPPRGVLGRHQVLHVSAGPGP